MGSVYSVHQFIPTLGEGCGYFRAGTSHTAKLSWSSPPRFGFQALGSFKISLWYSWHQESCLLHHLVYLPFCFWPPSHIKITYLQGFHLIWKGVMSAKSINSLRKKKDTDCTKTVLFVLWLEVWRLYQSDSYRGLEDTVEWVEHNTHINETIHFSHLTWRTNVTSHSTQGKQ